MNFQTEIKEHKAKIEEKLGKYLSREKERAKLIDSANAQIMEFIIDFCLRGGKRIRPILCIKGYEAVGGRNRDEIIRASISLEFLEAYLLIHDDIIDQDDIRRGGPSFHKLSSTLRNEKHFGISSAIVAGDMLGSLATKVILETNFREDLKLCALRELMEAEINCFQGELYDVVLESKTDVKEENLMQMVDLKTASYTTQLPLVMGAILGEASDKQIEILREYGHHLGRAFQITDDILGTFGDEKTVGKPVDSDIKQGKKTLLSIYALERASDEEKQFLLHSFGNKNLMTGELKRVREIIAATGALDYSKSKALEYAKMAKSILEHGNFTPKSKEFLKELPDFIVKRNF